MLKLDNTLLDELGLGGLPEAQKRAMLQHIYETLELRVGTNLANQMTDQQLEEFEKFIDEGGDADQAQALKWLEANLPNYKQVVNEVFEALKAEIKQMAPQLMAASGASAAQPAAPAQIPLTPQPGFGAAPAAPAAVVPPSPAGPYAAPMPTAPAPSSVPVPEPTAIPGSAQPPFIPAAPVPMSPMSDPLATPTPQTATDSFAPPAQPAAATLADDTQQQGSTGTDNDSDDKPQDYPFPSQQPPAGPGGYPPRQP